MLKRILRRTPLYESLRDWRRRRNDACIVKDWERRGHPNPPPHIVKQRVLEAYSQRFGLTTLVETGTYYGDMVEAMRGSFHTIFSIELSEELFEKAKERFHADDHVEIIQGDSAVQLKLLMSRIDQPTLFWLDGHYSAGVTARGAKDTPIAEELHEICGAAETGHVVIIDDARLFGTDPGYPTMESLEQIIRSHWPDARIAVEHDSIRVTRADS